MRLFSRLEGWIEGAFEGASRRVFRSRVQPAEIAKRLERAMEDNQTVGVGRVFAANAYRVALHPRDFEAYERYRASLERELSAYLQDRARETGLTLATRPKVTIDADERARPGAVQVEAWLQDIEGPDLEPRIEYTQPIEVPRARQREARPATLTVVGGTQTGQRYALPPGRVRLGRALDNEIVVEDSRVSRHHAELYLRGTEWHLRDLDSTNGTYVNGYGIRERALESGDRISLGGMEMVFHSRR